MGKRRLSALGWKRGDEREKRSVDRLGLAMEGERKAGMKRERGGGQMGGDFPD